MIEGCNFHLGTCNGCNLYSICYRTDTDKDYPFCDNEPIDLEVYFD